MNDRQKGILHMLLKENRSHVRVQDIAAELNCSEKTIRNDFDQIERYLAEHTTAELLRKPGIGVSLAIGEREKEELLATLVWSASDQEYKTDAKRFAAIAYRLLMESRPTTIRELAAQHFVNKAAIKKDLERLQPWFKKYNLAIVSKQRVGVTAEGEERNIRAALSKLSQLTGQAGNHFIKNRFAPHEIELVTRELKRLETEAGLSFTDEAMDNLLVHTLLMVRRTKLKQPISFSEQERSLIREKREFPWTEAFARRLERVFAVRFPEDEVAYLTAHILGGKIRSQTRIEAGIPESGPTGASDQRDHVSGLAESLVRRMSALTLVDFARDPILMEGLRIHLHSAVNRLSYGLIVTNPMLPDIKKMYPYMFDMVIDATRRMGDDLPFAIPEEEAAYLTLHFQAAVERLSQPAAKPKQIITVCHMGIGVSHILRTKLERKFPELKVLDSVRKVDLPAYLARETVDFIVSTTPLENVKPPHIVVSPLLDSRDIRKLEGFIGRMNEESDPSDSGSILRQFTRPSLVFPLACFGHRFEIIEYLANRLHEQGFVEQDYAHQALLRERVSATTIGGGIAIPHGDPKLIRSSQIAVATLKEPLDWDQEKVSVVFMLALDHRDQDSMKKLFQRLSLLSEQPSAVERIIRADTPEELLGCL
ncbi:PRD domain-containing protein [Paenibacillus macerans]|uniref:PRD domain-containing protein n=3 Tax=Paenibacillus macerans TaxID=44252 RepID=A0A6N8ERF7_PAEMA|nr:BglG family transcription antiterminator [Paenibacillus macerans]MUG22499.1 PRD domain-containing protein [Paenibacillus macerans]UMV49260.1 BglG family transcription antiterminator [Paenibacillus macerans]